MGYSISKVLKILRIARSTYYYQKNYRVEEKKVSEGRPAPGYSYLEDGKKISDEQIKELILEEIAGDAYNYGYRKITKLLRRGHKLIINKKKIYRLCKELGVLRPQREKKGSYPRKLARNRLVEASNQLWELDIKYGFIVGEDRFFFVSSIIDVYDRSIVDYHMGLTCKAEEVVQSLKRALLKRQQYTQLEKPVIRTDNGPQFISHTFEEFCESSELEHERIPPKTPNMNAHIESFHRILEDDCLSRWDFETYSEAYQAVSEFMIFYNERRMHSSILDLSPKEFFEEHLRGKAKVKAIKL